MKEYFYSHTHLLIALKLASIRVCEAQNLKIIEWNNEKYLYAFSLPSHLAHTYIITCTLQLSCICIFCIEFFSIMPLHMLPLCCHNKYRISSHQVSLHVNQSLFYSVLLAAASYTLRCNCILNFCLMLFASPAQFFLMLYGILAYFLYGFIVLSLIYLLNFLLKNI